MKAFLLEHETTLLPMPYRVAQMNVTHFSCLIVAGLLVGHTKLIFPLQLLPQAASLVIPYYELPALCCSSSRSR